MFDNIPPITRNIILINIVVYVVSNFFLYVLSNPELYIVLSGYYPFSPLFHSWQVITHMFMHAEIGAGIGIMHIVFNMFTLWSFSFLERILGGKRFLILYFLSGIGAFVLFNAWEFIRIQQIAFELQNTYGLNIYDYFSGADPNIKGAPESIDAQLGLINDIKGVILTRLVGASGAIFGVVAAFATLFPNERLIFMFIPYPIKAKYLLVITVVVSVYLGVNGSIGGIAHFAHVGGALVGYILARIWRKHLNRFQQQ
ncbi:membrane associated rhomboid family serine protease [Chryseobacterium defluvii]|uniref:Membrane associated rhomboid family serine protease n=1 Tax=Chryseobacterium defluvii TaxID=160396 RepID=A0A840KI44_9FLAO|nr:rhomboid family intramembrane serine protease [Chryseobacterium defluvii]MBB4807354.1 membrane associated rhomboid family serine protease [Chryseobacterium defluvii]